jgi:hypothetical protein
MIFVCFNVTLTNHLLGFIYPNMLQKTRRYLKLYISPPYAFTYFVFFHPSFSSLPTAYILCLFLIPDFVPLLPLLPIFSYSFVIVFVPVTSIMIPPTSSPVHKLAVELLKFPVMCSDIQELAARGTN